MAPPAWLSKALKLNLTWEAGRRLSTLQKGETSVSYTYNAEGTRIGKTVNGRTKNYLWDGGKLLSQTFANDTQVFLYHGDSRVALEFMGQLYYYVYNLQGDVVGLVDKTGTTMVTYKYDVWGKPESTTGPMATTLGVANPFRYRGYYYDTESGFYYLQSRYYDPEVGRFLNADAYLNSGHMLGTNAYVYCYNNPVMYADYTGCIPEWLYAVAAAAAAADGPLPFGDLLLVGVCVAGAVSALSALPQIEAPERHLTEIIPFPNQNNNNNKKKQEGPAPLIPPITAPRPKEDADPPGDTIVYRWAAGRNSDPRDYRNLTPRPWSDNDGLSFSLVPTTSRRNARTTLSALRSAGFICTVSGTHVSVMPAGGQAALASWKNSYDTARTNPHKLTLLLYDITR